ncbi:acyltransferase [Bradyrhizobium sp. C-145]|uniref:acyltransferase family protein n=1 Tax=Bradyrhizobium sp. C-145 TaxID=574727 RepID=UPI00201B78E7|nr:acyltransferase [Bradyrhizobium sp. C-145]UQR60733.1 acyltransferase [Bradyrhizobium sp. C-145]
MKSERSVGIDCLRAVAIIWVLLYHFVPISLFNRGTHGVLLFFIISGYCISLSAEHSRSAWHFYCKRVGRLLPALVICGFVTTAFKHTAPHLIESSRLLPWRDYAYTLIALPTLNVLRIDYSPPDWAYWSLIVEFQFYVLCAAIVAVGLRSFLLPAVGVWCLARFALSDPDTYSTNDFFAFFLAGLSIAALAAGHRKQALFGLATALFLECAHELLHYNQPSVPMEGWRLVTLIVGTLAVFLASQYEAPRWLRPVAFIGLISYPLYLIHQDVGKMILHALHIGDDLPADLLVRAFALPAVLGAVSWLVYHFVEQPYTKPLTAFLRDPIYGFKTIWGGLRAVTSASGTVGIKKE